MCGDRATPTPRPWPSPTAFEKGVTGAGLSIATSVRVGHEIGRGDQDAAALAGKVSLALGCTIGGLGALAFELFPGPLSRVFSPEPEVLVMAISLVRIAGLYQVSDGLQIVAQGCLRGVGDTRTPLVANLISHWGGGAAPGLRAGLPRRHGGAGPVVGANCLAGPGGAAAHHHLPPGPLAAAGSVGGLKKGR